MSAPRYDDEQWSVVSFRLWQASEPGLELLNFLPTSRTRWQITLALIASCVGIGCLAVWPAYKRHNAIRAVQWIGGTYSRYPVKPTWLRRWGIESSRVSSVDFLDGSYVSDERLRHISNLAELQYLRMDRAEFPENGLKHLANLKNLKWLNLSGSTVTDKELQHLKGLTKLQRLDLTRTEITDDGLQHLSALTSLGRLSIGNTRVSRNGAEKLRKSLPKCKISWSPRYDVDISKSDARNSIPANP